jgi:hypothetical protein
MGQRSIDLLKFYRMQHHVEQIYMSEKRLFLVVKEIDFLRKGHKYNCVEFDRQSMLVVGYHEGYNKIKICH